MTPDDDPISDMYKLFDQTGLTYADLMNSKEHGLKVVNNTRTALANALKSYIVRRDHEMYNRGWHASKPRKIDIKEEQ